ncbi:DUF1365 domain-containing protein [Blastopirellula marina]|uniref:DUF1365 domain-containing protein n=1 Tax=Blastopirellula marina TaxID=124 RepID=A0A2S8FEM3_9BACT|nr:MULTISPECIES: DUF1365 domain-containing protein [Pirellulaceae]PQO30618.1 DUF1365 domain-containing protein [Blastopirellula marina]RCS50755.1 DUF1365 domain-containing protein [Bremerella cremea]
MHSCLYEGTVSHARYGPVKHQFNYRLTMACFDLAELDQVVGPGNVLSDHRRAAISFPRDVHLRTQKGSLEQRVRWIVSEELGQCPRGPIHLLTQLRYFGYYFSPLNIFFVYDNEEDDFPAVILAEVNNIPWGEQQVYVLQPVWSETDQAWIYEHPKQMHVSPFMPMNHTYRWSFHSVGDQLIVGLENYECGSPVFHAGMSLEKKPLAQATLQRFLWHLPAMSLKVVAAIYYEAWKLWWKRCPIYPHPQSRPTAHVPVQATEPA